MTRFHDELCQELCRGMAYLNVLVSRGNAIHLCIRNLGSLGVVVSLSALYLWGAVTPVVLVSLALMFALWWNDYCDFSTRTWNQLHRNSELRSRIAMLNSDDKLNEDLDFIAQTKHRLSELS